jgi:uncharacterized protein
MAERITSSNAALQHDIFAFMADPANHGGAPVERIDTHGAAVFLAGDRALKIKRAIRFPFLDYSTLARRKAACDQELEVNRRFAPETYRAVVPITRRPDGTFGIGGGGEVVEWAVEMVRFDEQRTFDRLAPAGSLDSGLVAATADAIAASHRAAPPADGAPWVASIEPIIADNTNAFAGADDFTAAEVAALDSASRAAFTRNRALLEHRAIRGFVRWCHGDLHLANIVLIDDRPVLFDAIEFDPAFASVDVLYDLAFALMDLLRYGCRDAAAILLNRYLGVTDDANLDALAALPLLQSLRAAIRAKVMLSRPATDAATRRENHAIAKTYFDLALRLIAPPPPRLIAVGGLSGTGKSVLAQALAGRLAPLPGAVLLRSDVIRKRRFGVGDTERLGADAYRPEVTEQVYRALAERARRILAQGYSVIVDAVFSRPGERCAIETVARQTAVAFNGLFLSADLATRIERIGRRTADASDATPEIVRQQQSYDNGKIDWHGVDAGGTPQQTLDRALEILSQS